MNSTYTTKGCIPHLRVVTADGVVFAPVKLVTEENPRGGYRVRIVGGPSFGAPVPVELGGQYVYVLPGGGTIMAGDLRGQLPEAA